MTVQIATCFGWLYAIFRLYKDKAIPLLACTGTEGSRKLRLPDFNTIGT